MRKVPTFVLVALLALLSRAPAQTVEVVNMMPAGLSAEANQDSEPDITVNPNNPLEIVATAFTPNPSGALTEAPVYLSQDGGATWALMNIVPSGNGMTGDITVSISRGNVLYAGILRGGAGLDMRVLRGSGYAGGTVLDELLARTNEDQPYARSYAPMGGPGRDRDNLYVGHNDFNNLPQSASFEQSLDARTAAPPAGLATIRLERRTPAGQDGPPIRQAIHPDGTVYAVYTQRTASSGNDRTGNIVVVRDDDRGQGASPYSDVTDPGDATAGVIVANNVTWVFNNAAVFGQERLGDKATIAVDPNDSRVVYVGWVDRPAPATGNNATVHVRRSTDGGITWSADVLTVASSLSPQLAVNIRGTVGVAYQELAGTAPNQRWRTHFQQSDNGGASWADFILADASATSPVATFLPYLGDYLGLTAVGKDFVGAFSASNLPDNANFPSGVTYQRAADFAAHTLNDGAGGAVSVSIDPFFFRVRNQAENLDFYVRDWTDSPTANDIGLEPSTDPIFYNTSDVWNRRSDTPGGFGADDRPISEDPWPSTLGTNFAFARVHRKQAGAATSVNMHFLKSEFGTGSNYEDAGASADPTISFGDPDLVQTMTNGYQWDLNATTSTHVCLAVEISTADDPVVAPSLLGRAPGWPDTDLSVLYDNNKAQRNLGVYTASGSGGSITTWALVHNSANFRRDIVLRVEPDPRFRKLFGRPELVSSGGAARFEGDRVVFPAMTPCEHRWVGLTVPVTPEQGQDQRVMVNFAEMVGNLDLNGFSIALDRAPIEVGGGEGLRLLAANLARIGAIAKDEEASKLAKQLAEGIGRGKVAPDEYVKRVREAFGPYGKRIEAAVKQAEADPFDLVGRLSLVREMLDAGEAERICPRQMDLDHAVDAFLTATEKRKGDLADVAQNMRWQRHLAENSSLLRRVPGVAELARLSGEFDRGYANRRLSAKDYPAYMKRSLPTLQRINQTLLLGQRGTLEEMEKVAEDPRALQRLHCMFLVQLEAIRSKPPATDAPLVVVGTVTAAGKSSVPQLRASDETYLVQVEKPLVQGPALADLTGRPITIVDARRSLKEGSRYVIHADPFVFGRNLAARLVEAEEGPRVNEIDPKVIREFRQTEQLKDRLRRAELVVTGTVTAVRPYQTRQQPESEHMPDLRLAVVKVNRVLKGEAPGEQVEFLFAGAIDVHWFRTPKFKGGEEGVFLLERGAPETASLKLDDRRFTLLNPLDFQPPDRVGAIEALTR